MVREILDKRWWKVLGKFDTKEELIDSVRTVLEEKCIDKDDIKEQELVFIEERRQEAKKRRQEQLKMSIDDYRIVQKQKQAEYLVAREMKRMAKMLGRKKLLSYEPKVYVLHEKNWNENNCGGYVT